MATHSSTLAWKIPWGRTESDTTERLHFHFSLSCIREGNGSPLQCSCLENPRDGVQPRQDPFQDCNPVCLGTVSGFQVLAPAFCWHTLSTGGEAIPWDQVPCTLDSQDTCAQLLLPWGCARAVFHEELAASRTVLCALCSSGEISG